MKNKFLILLFTSLLLSTLGYGQAPLSERIDRVLSGIVKPNEPGFAVGVVKNGQFIYKKGFGLADLKTTRKITTETSFNIASDGKKFTAACIYLLQAQGKLKTSDKISKYFKDLPKYADSISINHLIHHQSGLRDYDTLSWLINFDENSLINDENAYQIIASQHSLNFTPGDQFSYSNSGYFLLSLIIKKVSGLDLVTYANQYIFKPLKMNNTAFSRTHQVPDKAKGYVLENKNFVENILHTKTIGQGNVYSKISDWDKWFMEMKQHTILGDSIWKKMLETSKTNDGKSTIYAGGLFVSTYKNKRLISHGGDLSGYHSSTRYLPNEDLGIVVFTNNDTISADGNFDPNDISDKILAEIYPEDNKTEDLEEKNIEVPYAKKANPDTLIYSGYYKLENDTSKIFYVSGNSKKLIILQGWNETTYLIVPLNDSLYYLDKSINITFQFKSVMGGKMNKLAIIQDGKTTVASRIKTTEITPFNNNEMSFFNNEINSHYKIVQKGDNLQLIMPKASLNLVLLNNKKYRIWEAGTTNITFKYSNDKIKGFTLNHERISNLEFKKE